ncbi:plexin domain containing lethal (1) G0289 isoform X2 [Oratosquilla oratoria]|uniref:plexin domain containing lethal (1) G0289 isoform X2 n=1 Tax=Oratosquilla oratoria TaxID=337810 RepID=UPI003F77041F
MATKCTLCLSLLLFSLFLRVSFSLSDTDDRYYKYLSVDSKASDSHAVNLRLIRSAGVDDDDDDDGTLLYKTNKEPEPKLEETAPTADNKTENEPVAAAKPADSSTTEKPTTVAPTTAAPVAKEPPPQSNVTTAEDDQAEDKEKDGDNETNKGSGGFKPISEDPNTVDDPDTGDDTFSPVEELNSTATRVDHHRYYKSVTFLGEKTMNEYWVDFDKMKDEVRTNKLLSNAYRRAVTVKLSFDFPFYGHQLNDITIATGGFLFTGNYVHTWLAATQYIAPLMANFDTSTSENATIKYADNGTSFTVQWNDVPLKNHSINGTFSFQVTLHKSGNIVFVYKNIPVTINEISDEHHPVKVGISDAYIMDRIIFYVRRKTIYEYHKIDMKKDSNIQSHMTIVFKALPTCVSMKSCNDCLSNIIPFPCYWCNAKQLCSSGLDRNRQDWIQSGCDMVNTDSQEACASLTPPTTTTTTTTIAPSTTQPVETFGKGASVEPHTGEPVAASTNMGVVVGTVFIVALLLAVVGWVAYAYFFPHTPSGQFLIRNRPSMWSLRRGEARYTPAAIHSIHM